MDEHIKEEGKQIAEQLILIRRDIHMHPELGLEEKRTAKKVADILRELEIQVQEGLCQTGVVGLLKGRHPGPTIALRADMDALQLEEENDVPYRSTIPGKMHACAHDGHVAILLGVAMILSTIKEHLHGQVKFVFQPAEELGPTGGAQFLIEEGVLEGPVVDAMVGYHIFPHLPMGTISLKYGLMMAASDKFKINIQGKGGHPGLPHETIDAIVVGGQIITALQSIVSRNIDPLEPAVLSLGRVSGGTRYNIISRSVEIEGTARTVTEKTRAFMEERIRDLVQEICRGMGATGEVIYQNGYPHLENDHDLVSQLQKSLTRLLGEDRIILMERSLMGSEDFAHYAHRVPSAYIAMGGGVPGEDYFPNHHPRFDFDEGVLEVGATALSTIAFDYLKVPSTT